MKRVSILFGVVSLMILAGVWSAASAQRGGKDKTSEVYLDELDA